MQKSGTSSFLEERERNGFLFRNKELNEFTKARNEFHFSSLFLHTLEGHSNNFGWIYLLDLKYFILLVMNFTS